MPLRSPVLQWKKELYLVSLFSPLFLVVHLLSCDESHFVSSDVFAGAGVALALASKELDKLQTTKPNEKIAIQLFQNALQVSFFCTHIYIFF